LDKSKKHIVFGAGLIGCYLGGVLTHFEHHTKLVCRPNIKRKLSAGIRLTDYLDNNISIKHLTFLDTQNRSRDTEDKENHCDFLWLTVKCTGVDQASKDILPLVGHDTVILCCQNGLGSDAMVRQYYPNNLVLRVMIHFNIVEIQPAHLHRGSEGGLVIESTAEAKEIIDRLVISCYKNR